jgi:hypothetical protein
MILTNGRVKPSASLHGATHRARACRSFQHRRRRGLRVREWLIAGRCRNLAPRARSTGRTRGEWTTEETHPLLPGIIHGRATFEWLEGKRFLVWRSDNPPGTVPRALAVIGGGETPGVWPMHSDERGVMRVYQVGMDGGVWRPCDRSRAGPRQHWRFQDKAPRVASRGSC